MERQRSLISFGDGSLDVSSRRSDDQWARRAAGHRPARNPGLPLDLAGFRSAVHQRSLLNDARDPAAGEASRSLASGLAAAPVTCLDLTTLQGDDTPGNSAATVRQSAQPVRQDIWNRSARGHLSDRGWRGCACTTTWLNRQLKRGWLGDSRGRVSTGFRQVRRR